MRQGYISTNRLRAACVLQNECQTERKGVTFGSCMGTHLSIPTIQVTLIHPYSFLVLFYPVVIVFPGKPSWSGFMLKKSTASFSVKMTQYTVTMYFLIGKYGAAFTKGQCTGAETS